LLGLICFQPPDADQIFLEDLHRLGHFSQFVTPLDTRHIDGQIALGQGFHAVLHAVDRLGNRTGNTERHRGANDQGQNQQTNA